MRREETNLLVRSLVIAAVALTTQTLAAEPLRLSGGAGERRGTRGAGCALDPTCARRGEPEEFE
jgi:hypothetical protein